MDTFFALAPTAGHLKAHHGLRVVTDLKKLRAGLRGYDEMASSQ